MINTTERITLTLTPEPWTRDAACQEVDPDAFFPEGNACTRSALNTCAGCTVRQQCLEYAIRNGETTGIWGGLSAHQISRRRKDAA